VTNPSGGFVTCGFISSPMYVSSEARGLPRPNHGRDAGDSSLALGMTQGNQASFRLASSRAAAATRIAPTIAKGQVPGPPVEGSSTPGLFQMRI